MIFLTAVKVFSCDTLYIMKQSQALPKYLSKFISYRICETIKWFIVSYHYVMFWIIGGGGGLHSNTQNTRRRHLIRASERENIIFVSWILSCWCLLPPYKTKPLLALSFYRQAFWSHSSQFYYQLHADGSLIYNFNSDFSQVLQILKISKSQTIAVQCVQNQFIISTVIHLSKWFLHPCFLFSSSFPSRNLGGLLDFFLSLPHGHKWPSLIIIFPFKEFL